MSGILDKKNRILDYKLTENGRKQIQNGDIRFRFYSFSDSSIVYSKSLEHSSNNICNSNLYYLPFEVSTDPVNYLNPEYNLSDIVDFNFVLDDSFNIIEDKKSIIDKNAKFTLSDQIISKKLLDTKYVNIDNNFFTFKVKNSIDTIDFKSKKQENIEESRKNIINYPSIKSIFINTRNLNTVCKDSRFYHKLNHKKLLPINKDGSNIFNEDLSYEKNKQKNSNTLFSYDTENTLEDIREETLLNTVNKLKNIDITEIFKSELVNHNNSNSNSILAEIHEIDYFDSSNTFSLSLTQLEDNKYYKVTEIDPITSYEDWEKIGYHNNKKETPKIEEVFRSKYEKNFQLSKMGNSKVIEVFRKLKKMPFVDIGSVIDESTNKNIKVFLIGKFISNKVNKEISEYNQISKNIKRNIDVDYSFINIFTMIVE